MTFNEVLEYFENNKTPFEFCAWRAEAWPSQNEGECFCVMIDKDGELKLFDDPEHLSPSSRQLTDEDKNATDWTW